MRSALVLLLVATLAACDAAAPTDGAQADPAPAAPAAQLAAPRVEPAPEWTDLFDRSSGWTGADGIFSIPLSGVDATGEGGTRTAFLFSDTFLGDVNPDGTRAPGTRLVNNTIGILSGDRPDPRKLRFVWGREGGEPAAVFVPETPLASPGDYYWLGDGFVSQALGGTTVLFAHRVRSVDGWFEQIGTALITLPPGSRPPFRDHEQTDFPFWRPDMDGRGAFAWGSGLFVNTAEAGAPDPDGFVYVYGSEQTPFVKHLLAARVPAAQFGDFSAWRFYDGEGWSPDVADAARLADRVSNELSLTPLPGGGYGLVFQIDTIGPHVVGRTAPTPVGPFGPIRRLYTTPESGQPGLTVYNAKGHPHLSEPGTLLISYNVNALDFGAHFADADIYRPRFVRLRF